MEISWFQIRHKLFPLLFLLCFEPIMLFPTCPFFILTGRHNNSPSPLGQAIGHRGWGEPHLLPFCGQAYTGWQNNISAHDSSVCVQPAVVWMIHQGLLRAMELRWHRQEVGRAGGKRGKWWNEKREDGRKGECGSQAPGALGIAHGKREVAPAPVAPPGGNGWVAPCCSQAALFAPEISHCCYSAPKDAESVTEALLDTRKKTQGLTVLNVGFPQPKSIGSLCQKCSRLGADSTKDAHAKCKPFPQFCDRYVTSFKTL